MSNDRPDAAPHRFFRAMVLMGSGIALGCGGLSDVTAGTGASGGSSAQGGTDTGGAGTGGTGTGGTTSGVGGTGGDITLTGGSGGTTGGSGGTTGGSGGTTSSAGMGGVAGAGGNLDCQPSQWSCAPAPQCGADGYGYELPTHCTCDFTRPAVSGDCAGGVRACLEATTNADGTLLSEVIPFECVCAAVSPTCGETCSAAFPDGDTHECSDLTPKRLPQPPPPVDVLCGCALVFLR